jgi:outer membrane protein assembly factor BamB
MPTTTTPAPTEVPYTVQLADAWTLDIGGEPEFPPVLVQGSVCVVTDGRIVLISVDGDVLWDRQLTDVVFIAPISSGESVYLVYADGSVERRDAATGEVLWKKSVGAYPAVPVCAYGECLYVAINAHLLCLLAETGEEIWDAELPGGTVGTGIVPYGDKLFLDTFAHNVTVVDAGTGAILDEWDARCYMSNIFVHDDSMYAMGGRCLTCLDADTGTANWEYIFPGGGTLIPAFVDYPYAVISTIDDRVLCVNIESGEFLWSDDAMYRAGFALSGEVLISGIAYIPDMYKTGQGSWDPSSTPSVPTVTDGNLVAWDISTGARVLSMPADLGLKWPVAIEDRFVFVTGTSLACYTVGYG